MRGFFLALLIVLLTGIGSQCARAHDWYRDLKQPGTGFSCCNEQKHHEDGRVTGDCRPTIAEEREDGWYAMVNGHWMYVPPSKIVRISPPDGRSHVCANWGGIICFIAAEPRS